MPRLMAMEREAREAAERKDVGAFLRMAPTVLAMLEVFSDKDRPLSEAVRELDKIVGERE